jgi:putative Mn2+ efflux pump MntP
MFGIIILIFALSLDAFSFGIAQGICKNKIPLFAIICMSVLSTILFGLPLYLSSIISSFLDVTICNIINGVVLILLGLIYVFKFIKDNSKQTEMLESSTTNKDLSLGYYLICTIPLSLDAIFTAFLSSLSVKNMCFSIVFYLIITFFALFLGNRISIKMTGKSKLNVEWLSGIIFVVLGILKIFGI